jgi:RNA polymerase sigma factor (TIGR02999 family)
MSDQANVTQLLVAAREGDRSAMDRLFPLIYDELRRKAHAQRAGGNGLATMNTTAIVHEAYIKLADRSDAHYESRLHFYAVAAKAMRHVFLDYAKRKRAGKRGAGAQHVVYDDGVNADTGFELNDDQADSVIELEHALARFSEKYPRQSNVVECRFFGGMTVEDTALLLDTSPATVKRDWVFAQAWLFRTLQKEF